MRRRSTRRLREVDHRLSGETRRLGGDDRGVATVVGKLYEIGLVLLFVSVVTISLYGGIVPAYQTDAGNAVAERTLSMASQRVQQAIPPDASAVDSTLRVELPETIRGHPYEIDVVGRSLVISHPNPEIDASAKLALPDAVVSVSGEWSSQQPALVVVESTSSGLVVTLEVGS